MIVLLAVLKKIGSVLLSLLLIASVGVSLYLRNSPAFEAFLQNSKESQTIPSDEDPFLNVGSSEEGKLPPKTPDHPTVEPPVSKDPLPSDSGNSNLPSDNPVSPDPKPTPEPTPPTPPKPTPTPTPEPKPEYKIGKALYVGDSRMENLKLYSSLKGDFYCRVGMSIFNMNKEPISIPSVGKVYIKDLLRQKQYDTIYIMLGFNEFGYPIGSIRNENQKFLDLIHETQPNAKIVIMANLRTTKALTEVDPYANNVLLDKVNALLASFANNENIVYLDVNPIFDDGTGNLDPKYTNDGAHLKAKYVPSWGNWIEKQTIRMFSQ